MRPRPALLRFPDPVNEIASRLVAAGVVVASGVYLTTEATWVLAVIAWGFWARVTCGPGLSPLALLVTQFIVPRLDVSPRPVPAAPKRFAQGIGAVMSTVALGAALAGFTTAAGVVMCGLVAAAAGEAVFGFCVGCKIYGQAARAGWLPEPTCAPCADLRPSRSAAARSDR
jgi:hypothetical protein